MSLFEPKPSQWEAKLFESMNPEQIEVIKHDQGPCLVVACAGSGKTTAVVRRMAYLTKVRGVTPSRILGTTFSKKAAEEMSDRIETLIGDNSVRVQTFHSFCRAVLAEEMAGFELWKLDDNDYHYKTHCMKRAMETVKWIGGDIQKMLSLAEAVKANAVKVGTPELNGLVNERFHRVADRDRAVEAYTLAEELRVNNRIMTFSDWLVYTYELFAENEKVRARWAARFDYVMVDEGQDNNRVQSLIVRQLCTERRNIMLIGDSNQAIFSFRGAAPELFTSFVDDWNAHRITMHRNYRSVGSVIDAANVALTMMGEEAQNFSREMTAVRTQEGKVQIDRYETQEDEANGVIDRILAFREDGSSLTQCVVLYRTNMLSRAIEEAMIRRRVPYQIVGAASFYTRTEISTLVSYLKVVQGTANQDDLYKTLLVPKKYLGKKFLDAFVAASAKHRDKQFADLIEPANSLLEKALSAGQKGAAMKWAHVIDDTRDVLRPGDALRAITERVSYAAWLKEDEGSETAENDRISNVAEMTRAADGFSTIPEFLKHVQSQIDATKKARKDQSMDKVTLMTCHRSKGLEWPHVFLLTCNENVMPHVWASSEKEQEEEKRIYYVAITRAKDTLNVSYVGHAVSKGKVREMQASPFIRPLLAAHISDETGAPRASMRVPVIDQGGDWNEDFDDEDWDSLARKSLDDDEDE